MRIMGFHTTGPAVKNHISSEMARDLIAQNRTMCHLWFLVYQRVFPQLHLHLLLQHLHHRIPYLMSTDTPKIQYQKESGSASKELWEDPLLESTETENKNKNEEREEGQRFFALLPDRLQEFRENLVDESASTEPWRNPEQGSQDTSKSFHELPMEPRAKVEPVSGKHSVCTHFPKDPNCDACLKTRITRASCRRRTGTVELRAEHFGARTILDMPWWYKMWQHSGCNHTCVKQTLPRRPRRT